MSAPELLFTFSATVRMHEVGPDDKAPVEVLLRLFQEAAGLHAESLAWGIESLMRHNLAWVMTRLFVEVDRYPGAGEQLVIETWPVSRVKYTARRDFRITDASGSEIVRGATNWVMMDVDARCMKSIPDEFGSMFELDTLPAATDFQGKKVPALGETESQTEVIARLEDLDRNGHVNNTHIAAWMLEAVPEDRASGMRLRSLDVQFRSEVCRHERLQSMCGPGGGDGAGEVTMQHSLMRTSDGIEAARARTVWTLL